MWPHRSYQTNVALLDDYRHNLLRTRQQLTEAKASGSSREVPSLEAQVRSLETKVVNTRDIILRQKSIKGFVIEAKAAYRSKEAEVKGLQGRLMVLLGK